jgi:xanthine dehydrogenase YagS FAD-binding subunit
MEPFAYHRAEDVAGALVLLDARSAYLAGGTELLNLLKERIATPARVVDINRLPLATLEFDDNTLRIGALARMSDVAADAGVRADFPAISESLELSASPQLRNMASMGGNLLQRTRCPYFRADASLPCNKRTPGSGCSALAADTRAHAVFGGSESCVATHPSDVAVALAAFDAVVHVAGMSAQRSLPLDQLYRLPEDRPQDDTTLQHGELIVHIDVPRTAAARRSRYLKVRERASYEFALVSAAVGLELDGAVVRDVRIALGGVAPKPWRLRAAEDALRGQSFARATLEAATRSALRAARPRQDNAFKVELAARTVLRAFALLGASA